MPGEAEVGEVAATVAMVPVPAVTEMPQAALALGQAVRWLLALRCRLHPRKRPASRSPVGLPRVAGNCAVYCTGSWNIYVSRAILIPVL